MILLSQFSAETSHAPSLIFAKWTDPSTWPEWDTEVLSVSFERNAVVGAVGKMKPASGPAVKIRITEIEPDRLFTNSSSLPGASLSFKHLVNPIPGGSRVRVEVHLTGLMAPLWKRILGSNLRNAAESSTTGLIASLDAS